LFTSGAEEQAAPVNTLPPPGVSTRANTPTPTITPLPTGTPTPTLSQRPTSTPTPVEVPNLRAFITAPTGVLPQPYVLVSAYGATSTDGFAEIRGKVGLVDFTCPGSQCLVTVLSDNTVALRAFTQSGNVSDEVSATIRVSRVEGGFTVTLESLRPATAFEDYCGLAWEAGGASVPSWAMFPQSPPELATDKILYYLASQLIANGVVNAADCPGGGMGLEGPNPCGLERTAQAMLEWQNQYNFDFWLAGLEQGVPPILLKTLIEHESQFWPMSQRYFLDEYGLAQVNELGTDVALRWDIDLYQLVCSKTLQDCPASYYRLRPSLRAMLRGSLLSQLFVDCPTCEYGIDLAKTVDSIPINTMILRYNCNDTKFMLDKYDFSASYEDHWKFTMLAYHSGINCLDYALSNVVRTEWDVTWSQVSEQLKCSGAREYVDDLWMELESFEEHRLPVDLAGVGVTPPTLVPTQTPVPTPTVALSRARFRVQVFADANGDGLPQDPEWVNGVQVLLQFADGRETSGSTVNGEVVFDLTGNPIGMGVTVSLPSFYRHESLTIPAEGETLVTFIFTEPVFPTALP
jgi:hypothetical protein